MKSDYKPWKSGHGREKMDARRIKERDVLDAVRFGRIYHQTGVVFYFIGRRDFPRGREAEFSKRRLEGLVVIEGNGGVITTYKNRHASKEIRRKPKRARQCRLHSRDQRRAA